MRTLVEPPPSSRCGLCGGELLLKQISQPTALSIWTTRYLSAQSAVVSSLTPSTLEQRCIGLTD